MTTSYGWAPEPMHEVLHATVALATDDERILGVIAAGSAATGSMDEFSDLDLVVVTPDRSPPEDLPRSAEDGAMVGGGVTRVSRSKHLNTRKHLVDKGVLASQ